MAQNVRCLLYTSDAADDSLRVDLGGRRIIKKKRFVQCQVVKKMLILLVFFKKTSKYTPWLIPIILYNGVSH